MVGVFLRLKWALLLSAFSRWQTALPVVLGIVYAFPGAAVAAVALAGFGRSGALPADPTLVLVGAGLTLAWTVGPVLGGIDTTVDPDALVLLPLTRTDRVRGLLAAGAVGVPSVATLVVLAGAVVGYLPADASAVPFLAAAVVTWLTCLLVARTTTTVLSAAASGRRSRDLLATVGFVGILGVSQLPNLANLFGVDRARDLLAPTADVLGVLPWGWSGSAMRSAAEGSTLRSAGWAVLGLGGCALAALAWIRVLDRVTERGPGQARTRVRGTGGLRGARRVLRPGPLRALVAKDLRYLVAEPQLRLALVAQVFFVGVALISVVRPIGSENAPWVVAGVAGLGGLYVVSLFGADRGASWTLVAAGVDWRDVVVSKLLATAAWAGSVQVLLTVVAGAVGGGWGSIVPAVLLGAGVLTTILAGGAVAATLVPVPLPVSRPGTGIFATRTGGAAGASLTQALATLLALVPASLPLVAAVVASVLRGHLWLMAVCVLSLVYGLVLATAATRLAARRGRRRGPEIVAALTRA